MQRWHLPVIGDGHKKGPALLSAEWNESQVTRIYKGSIWLINVDWIKSIKKMLTLTVFFFFTNKVKEPNED